MSGWAPAKAAGAGRLPRRAAERGGVCAHELAGSVGVRSCERPGSPHAPTCARGTTSSRQGLPDHGDTEQRRWRHRGGQGWDRDGTGTPAEPGTPGRAAQPPPRSPRAALHGTLPTETRGGHFPDGSAWTSPGRGLSFQPPQRDSDHVCQRTDGRTPSCGAGPRHRDGSAPGRPPAGSGSPVLTISPSSTTFSPLTTKMPRGMSPYFLPTWMRSTVWCSTRFAAAAGREREKTTRLSPLPRREAAAALPSAQAGQPARTPGPRRRCGRWGFCTRIRALGRRHKHHPHASRAVSAQNGMQGAALGAGGGQHPGLGGLCGAPSAGYMQVGGRTATQTRSGAVAHTATSLPARLPTP